MKTVAENAYELSKRVTCHKIAADDIDSLQKSWDPDPRWQGILRPYSVEDILKLRGTLK